MGDKHGFVPAVYVKKTNAPINRRDSFAVRPEQQESIDGRQIAISNRYNEHRHF